MITAAQFKAAVDDVVSWNAVARDGVHSHDADAIAAQSDYVHEELMETIAAIANKDAVEVLDGVADVFVTLVYKNYLQLGDIDFDELLSLDEPSVFTDFDLERGSKLTESSLIVHLSVMAMVNAGGAFGDNSSSDDINMVYLVELLQVVESIYGVDMNSVIKHVSESNWSKFPRVADVSDPEAVAKEIETVRGKTDVSFYAVEGDDGQARYVFRDGGGKGKIMKPLSYKGADCSIFL